MSYRKYWVAAKIRWQNLFEYRFDILVYTISNCIVPLLGLALWASASDGRAFRGYESREILIYFLLVAWISNLTHVWGSYFIGEDINRGNFSNFLLKPLFVTQYYLIWILSEKVYKTLFMSVVLISLSFYIFGDIYWIGEFRIINIVLFLISIILGFMIAFFLDIIIGISTFWVHDNDFIRQFYSLFEIVFSGKLIPLAFFPSLFYGILIFSPTRYWISFPIEVLMGKLNSQQLVQGFMIEVVWLLVAYGVYKFLMNKGIRLYQGYGA